jgi:hypothetical protein
MKWPRFFRRSYWDEERSREIEAYGIAINKGERGRRKKLQQQIRVTSRIYATWDRKPAARLL